jgi:hypothetical protein
MLPGFRFLFAAIMLTLSILICGLGATALLRVAHEDFASSPSWRPAPETTLTQQAEASGSVLAMLRVDTPIVEKSSDEVPAAELLEQVGLVPTPTKPENVAALNPADSALSEPAKPDIPVAESPARSEAAPALPDAPAPADGTRIAAIEQVLPPASGPAPAVSEQTSTPASPDIDAAATKIATLGGPPITIATQPPGKAAAAIPDQSAIKKRLQELRVAQRRRMARARLAAQQALQLQQQALNPFAQPAIRAQPVIR